MRADKSIAPVAVVVAEQEDLGDLKLYRVPEPVTINAKGQKQVAMIVKPAAAFEHYYAASVDQVSEATQPMSLMLRGENRTEKGLGLPMPAGQMIVFEDSKYGPLLTGQSSLIDRAIGDDVEIRVTSSSDVRISVLQGTEKSKRQRWQVTITNARNEPVNVEVEIPYELLGTPKSVKKIDGVPTWKTSLPANGDATLFFETKNN